MSADYPSSNPFRRKGAPAASPSSSLNDNSHIAYQQAGPPTESAGNRQADAPRKILKKVRVQSPPPPSPSIPDSASTIGEETNSIPQLPPTPITRDDDPFDSTNSDSDEDNRPEVPSEAPANPFSKTLETLEHTGRDSATAVSTATASPGKASMDVDAFKRLLMTGNASAGTSAPHPVVPANVSHALADGGSNTDASSVSKQSIFETIQEAHSESPRTSHEISEPEDDKKSVVADSRWSVGRRKPPPPAPRHGKLIKDESKDETTTPTTAQSPSSPASEGSQNFFPSSPPSFNTDLNKPLPLPPARASNEFERESVFDKEAAGKIPDPPSPSSSIRKKTPPAPPLSRRHSQLVSESKLTRTNSGRLSPKTEEDTTSISDVESVGRARSDSNKAPPPPPSRRTLSVRKNSWHNSPLASPSSATLPTPPPTRGSRPNSSGRPSSFVSLEGQPSNKRLSVMPPPPPPHRHGRTSFDGPSPDESRRVSGEDGRHSIDNLREGPAALPLTQSEYTENDPDNGTGGQDILADLQKLQVEIDELRKQGGQVT